MLITESTNTDVWETYFRSLPESHLNSINEANTRSCMQKQASDIFTSVDKLHVRITDVIYDKCCAYSRRYCNESQISNILDQRPPDSPHARIISIYAKNSISPLMMTADLMGRLMHSHKVHPGFLQIMLSFGEEPRASVASGTGSMIFASKGTDSYTSYQLNYVEENFRDPEHPWSFRRTGVYHHYSPERDLFILLHPNETSLFDIRLLESIGINPKESTYRSTSTQGLSSFIQNRHLVHTLLLSCFMDNWRWYLRALVSRFENATDDALTARPEEATPESSHGNVKHLRNLNDWACLALTCCRGDLDIIQKLHERSPNPIDDYNLFETTTSRCIESCEDLLPRIRNTTDMVGYTLTLQNQLEAAKVSKDLRDLTGQLKGVTSQLVDLQHHAIDDSAVVKIITVMSAVYLPGTFIVSLYGMNFFVFDEQERKIIISKDFWIFVATWIPLTLLTMGIYVLIVYLDRWWRRKPFQFFKRPGPQERDATDATEDFHTDEKA